MKENQKAFNEKKQNDIGGNAKTAFMELASLAGLNKNSSAAAPTCAPAETVAPFDVSIPAAPVLSVQPEQPSVETSIIAADVVMEGTIRTEGALDCRGVVKGDLIAKGSIAVSGKQIGNLQGLQISFLNACVEGNVMAQQHIVIDRGTKIKGNIQGGSIVLNGQVTGLLSADGLVRLCKNAVLNGDIQAGAISIEEGAQISGQINMKETAKK